MSINTSVEIGPSEFPKSTPSVDSYSFVLTDVNGGVQTKVAAAGTPSPITVTFDDVPAGNYVIVGTNLASDGTTVIGTPITVSGVSTGTTVSLQVIQSIAILA